MLNLISATHVTSWSYFFSEKFYGNNYKGNKVVTNDFPVQFPDFFFNVMYTFTKANATQTLMNTRILKWFQETTILK